MKVVLLNNVDFASHMFGEGADVHVIQPMAENVSNRLFNYLMSHNDATLFIDSELKTSEHSRYQNQEGLKIAYECRTHPEINYHGFIKLFGFSSLDHVKRNRFGGLLRSGEKIHAKEFILKGASYCRYPSVDIDEENALSEDEWRVVVDELDEIFVQEYRRFEHGFRNLIISKSLDADSKKEKKEELESHLKTLEQIERTTIIQQRYRLRFDAIRGDLRSLTDGFMPADESVLGDHLNKIKNDVHNFHEELVTLKRVR